MYNRCDPYYLWRASQKVNPSPHSHKGLFDSECFQMTCTNISARFWNLSTRKYYCESCSLASNQQQLFTQHVAEDIPYVAPWANLTNDQRQAQIAILTGWTELHMAKDDPNWYKNKGHTDLLVGTSPSGSPSYEVPKYLIDLNAAARLEERFVTEGEQAEYMNALYRLGTDEFQRIRASAEVRCHAFVNVMLETGWYVSAH